MNTFTVVALVCLAAVANASIHHGHGTVVSGPSGVVTDHGAVGPVHHGVVAHGLVGHGLVGHGLVGHGLVGHGLVGHGLVGHDLLGHGLLGHGLLGHGYGHAAVIAPAVHSVAHHGVVVAHHGYGHGFAHHGFDGVVAHGHHGGVVVEGPHTVPAVIKGPSGKIVADGLYGVPHHGHHW